MKILNIKHQTIARNFLIRAYRTWVAGNRRRAHRGPEDVEDGTQVHGQVVQHHIHVRDGDEVDCVRLQEVLYRRLVLA